MKSKLIKYDYLLVALVSFIYYLLLSSKIHTFLFVSGDSGDWLAGSIWWMNVQPYGSPLFVSLGHLLNAIPVSDLVIKMTVGLSVIPSAITVTVIYLIIKKITNNYKIAISCALVLLGSAVFLTQSTILEEYALCSMFITLAYYFYIQDKKKLTVLMLALGSAVQIIAVIISALWLLLNIRQIKDWYKTFWIYLVFGVLPYIEVLVLMAIPDSPKLLSGNLSWQGINNYLGATGTLGSMSLVEAPKRLLDFGEIIVCSLGFALVPLFISFKNITKQNKSIMVALITILLVAWMYLTDSDPDTWTFLTIAYPLIMVLVALGLSKMHFNHIKVVSYGACALIIVNGVFLNANILAHNYPYALEYEMQVRNLPDGSYIVTNSGGSYGLDNYYIMASGKDIRPIFIDGDIPNLDNFSNEYANDYKDYVKDFLMSNYNLKEEVANQQIDDMLEKKTETMVSPRYEAYLQWMNDRYGLHGDDTIQQVRYLLENNQNVYLVLPCVTPYWQYVFQIEDVTLDSVINDGSNDITWDSSDNSFKDLAKIVGVNTCIKYS